MTTGSTDGPRFDIAQPEFWRRPLQERMDDFAAMRAKGPFWDSEIPDTMGMMGGPVPFHAVTTYDEVVEISRRPKQFCSGRARSPSPTCPSRRSSSSARSSTWTTPATPASAASSPGRSPHAGSSRCSTRSSRSATR